MIDKITRNKKLCEKYPFLIPTSYDGTPIEDFDYSYITGFFYTPWESIWLEFCNALLKEYEKFSEETKKQFHFYDVKEKYGTMRISVSLSNDAISNAIYAAEFKSKFTCSQCGKQPRHTKNSHIIWATKGWLQYLCKNCAKKQRIKDGVHEPLNIAFTRLTHRKDFYVQSYSEGKLHSRKVLHW